MNFRNHDFRAQTSRTTTARIVLQVEEGNCLHGNLSELGHAVKRGAAGDVLRGICDANVIELLACRLLILPAPWKKGFQSTLTLMRVAWAMVAAFVGHITGTTFAGNARADAVMGSLCRVKPNRTSADGIQCDDAPGKLQQLVEDLGKLTQCTRGLAMMVTGTISVAEATLYRQHEDLLAPSPAAPSAAAKERLDHANKLRALRHNNNMSLGSLTNDARCIRLLQEDRPLPCSAISDLKSFAVSFANKVCWKAGRASAASRLQLMLRVALLCSIILVRFGATRIFEPHSLRITLTCLILRIL